MFSIGSTVYADVQLVDDQVVESRRMIGLVMPGVQRRISDDAIAVWPVASEFAGVRIALPTRRSSAFDPELVPITILGARHESDPVVPVAVESGAVWWRLIPAIVPTREIASQVNCCGVWSPTTKGDARFVRDNIRAHGQRMAIGQILNVHRRFPEFQGINVLETLRGFVKVSFGDGREKGVEHPKPERPFGCFALLVSDPCPFSQRMSNPIFIPDKALA